MPEIDRREQLLEQFAEMGRWDRLLEMGREVLAEDPENERIHQLMGMASLNEGRLKAARRHIEFAAGADPDNPFPHYLLGKLCEKENRPLFAKKHFLHALSRDPMDPGYFVAYGWNCLARGDFRSGYEAALEARKLDPENAEVENLLVTAESELETGTLGSGTARIEAYQEALALAPEDDTLHYQIGRTWLYEEDDVEAAEPRLRQALRLDPHNRYYQSAMLEVVRRKDSLLSVLHWPWRFIRRTFLDLDRLGAKGGPGLLVKAPVTLVKLLLAMVLLPFWAVFMWPPSIFYEWRRRDRMLADAAIDPGMVEGEKRRFSWEATGLGLVALAMAGVLVTGVWWLFSVPGVRENIGDVLGGLFIVFIIAGAAWCAKRQNL